jgi:DNA-directed RNA polymerase specialized sigma24 family protein
MASAVPAAGLRPVFQFPVAALGPAVTWPTALFLTLTSPRPAPPRPSSPPRSAPPRGAPATEQPETEAVTEALASLRREQRQVLMCTFYGRLSVDDAAARLGMPVRDVKRHARAALNEIRRVLTERGVPIPRQPALPA